MSELVNLLPQVITSSAAAASLLIAVLVFLYNRVDNLERESHGAYLAYAKMRTKCFSDLQSKLQNTGCTVTTNGAMGTTDRIEYEWSTNVYDPVPRVYAEADVLRNEFLNLQAPYLTASFRDSVIPTGIMNFQDRPTLDAFIKKHSLDADFSAHLGFFWIFLQRTVIPAQGQLTVQSIFVSAIKKKMALVKSTMWLAGIAALAFVLTIPLSVFAYENQCFALFALVPYFIGWSFVTWALRVILSFVPHISMRREITSPAMSMQL